MWELGPGMAVSNTQGTAGGAGARESCLETERDERDWEKLKRREWSSLFCRLLWCRQTAGRPVGCRRLGADALELTPWSLLNRRSCLAIDAEMGTSARAETHLG